MGRYPQPQAHLLSWVVVLTVMALGGLALEDSEALQERDRHYRRELDKTLQELGTSSSVHILHKRSASLLQDCDELVKHTQKTCPNWAITPKTPKGQLAVDNLDFYSDSKLPGFFVSKVTGDRVGKSLKVQFDIVHNSEIVIMEKNAIDSQKTTLALPKAKSSGLPVSTVTLTFDTSSCTDSEKIEKEVVIVPVGKTNNFIEAELEICDLEESTANGTPLICDVPLIKILNDPGDTIFIEPGKDVSIEVELRLNMISEYNFKYYLWNWRQQRMEYAKIKIDVESDGLDYDKEDDLLSLEVLDERNINNEQTGREAYTKEVKIRVTVRLGSEEMSGHLYVEQEYEPKHLGRKIIQEMNNARIISLNLPYKLSAFPPNTVTWRQSRSGCGRPNSKLCTVSCTAYGDNIKYIFMIKQGEFAPPIRSAVHFIDNFSTWVTQEVRPPPKNKEHIYRCVAVFKNGLHSLEDFTVYGEYEY